MALGIAVPGALGKACHVARLLGHPEHAVLGTLILLQASSVTEVVSASCLTLRSSWIGLEQNCAKINWRWGDGLAGD